MIATEQFRQVVAEATARLNAGEKPADVPCPKCQNHRYIALEMVGKFQTAACGCCGFHWFIS